MGADRVIDLGDPACPAWRAALAWWRRRRLALFGRGAVWSVLLGLGVSTTVGLVFGMGPRSRRPARTRSKRCATS